MTSTMRLNGVRLIGGDDGSVVDITVTGDRIEDVSPSDARMEPAADARWVAPGLVDLQVNGGWGHDLSDDPASVWEVGAGLADLGVTSWLPTLVSSDRSTRAEALAVLEAGPPSDWVGAAPLGWHFEGPYLNPARAGAHRLEALEPVPDALAAGRLDREPLPRLLTLAPEVPGAIAAIETLTAVGVVVSLGHTEASPPLIGQAVGAGATMATHLFNAMSGVSHRAPGAAVGLLNSDVWLGLIADGHHVDVEVLRLLWRVAGDRLVLVSDAMAALGERDGPTRLAGSEASTEQGAVRLPDGTLAGSALSLPAAAARFQRATGCSAGDLVSVASVNPCRAIGEQGRGSIAVGAVADLMVLDGHGELVDVLCAGRRTEVDGGRSAGSTEDARWRL